MKTFSTFLKEKSQSSIEREIKQKRKEEKKNIHSYIKSKLKEIGYGMFTLEANGQKSKHETENTVVFYTQDKNTNVRNRLIREVCGKLNRSGKYKPLIIPTTTILFDVESKGSGSVIVCRCYFNDSLSVGNIEDDFIKVIHKPSSKTKEGTVVKKNAGVANESALANAIRSLTGAENAKDRDMNHITPITIIFTAKDGNTTPIKIENIINCDEVGTDTAGRKKSDIDLICQSGTRTTVIPISIKQDNAHSWESADTYFGPYAKDVFERLAMLKKINYIKEINNKTDKVKGKIIKTTEVLHKLAHGSEIKIEITDPKQIEDVCFGNDLLKKNGFILQKTFKGNVLEPKNENKRIYACDCTFIAQTPKDVINSNHGVWLLLRNDGSRASSSMGYRGIRVEVMIGDQRNNAQKIDVDKLPTLKDLKDILSSKEMKAAMRDMSESMD